MLKKIFGRLGGDPNKKIIEQYADAVEQINALESQLETLSDAELAAKTDEFRRLIDASLASGEPLEETLESILIETFAVVREASKRTIGLRHYDVQLIGGIILHRGNVVEMRTGEGKTLVATLPLYLNALAGKGVHLITVNDYLARRDARWMAPIFDFLGLSVGVLQMGSRTEGGKKAFLVNLERESPTEDQHQLEMVDRKEAYLADITYGTNSEFGFDYLRDNGRMRLVDRVQRGHHYAVIDEIDNVLIDEARTPLIISGPSFDDAATYTRIAQVVKKLKPDAYEINEKDRTISLTESGEVEVERLLGMALRDPENPEEITDEQARLFGFLEQALRAEHLFRRDKDYIVQSRQVIIVDQITGRMMPGRRWSDGLHQAVEAKEGVPVQSENITHATITIQNYFRMYTKLAGMTGTAMTEAEEFSKIYSLETLSLPSNLEYRAAHPEAEIIEVEDTDSNDYRYRYYARMDDPDKLPYLWKRKDYPDMVYRTTEAKLRAIVREIIQIHCIGRPILVGTTSVENSERLSERLSSVNVQRLARVLLLRHAWLHQNNRIEDGRVISQLKFLDEPLDQLRNNDLKKFATDLGLTLDLSDENIDFLLEHVFYLQDGYRDALKKVLHSGVPHEVLNAREHTKESKLIAKAGQLGAVTIATNMAGRGVDIRLGGELGEEEMRRINRELKKHDVEGYYNLTLAEKARALEAIPESDYGIYADQIKAFIHYVRSMEKVVALGGLHVIGSERHEARRIDNQLRGRAARQGDPGSSRFYISTEDDLMRLFGGQQLEMAMARMGMDEQVPFEFGVVGRAIESAQTRVEGAHFDSRKHVLEYDDVLNSQRQTIYKQRDRIFLKEDLSDDILELMENEINARFSEGTAQERLPILLSWLNMIQPSFAVEDGYYPSLADRLLLEEVLENEISTQQQAVDALLTLANRAIDAHLNKILDDIPEVLQRFQERLDAYYEDRLESISAYFDELQYVDETEQPSDQDVLAVLKELAGLEIKPETVHQALVTDDEAEEDQPQAQKGGKYNKKNRRSRPSARMRNSTLMIENLDAAHSLVEDELYHSLNVQTAERIIGAVNRLLPDELALDAEELAALEWDAVEEAIKSRVVEIYDRKRSRIDQETQVGGTIERLENLFRYDRFIEALAAELQTYFNGPIPAESGVDRQIVKENVWRSVGNQIQIFIDRKKIAANAETELLPETRSLLTNALDGLSPANWDLDPSAWQSVRQAVLAKAEIFYPRWLEAQLIIGMGIARQEPKSVFAKGGKRSLTNVPWFSYWQHLSDKVESMAIEDIREMALEHLQNAHLARVQVFGLKVWRQLQPDWQISDLPEPVHTSLAELLPDGKLSEYTDLAIKNIHPDDYDAFITALGRFELSEYYREIFLRVISSLWIDYITQMEALRVKIGLEAYAQRDPLVAYKTQASELFQDLFKEMQRDVVTKMFGNRGRRKGQKMDQLVAIDRIRETRRELLSEDSNGTPEEEEFAEEAYEQIEE
jgi:preprotein translocase subunit SecA